MKTICTIMLLFAFLQQVFCQLTGTIITVKNKPVPYANVLLLNSADTTLVKATFTNEEGVFVIENVQPGNYKISINSTGYQVWISRAFTITTTIKNKDFGKLVMQEQASDLSAVVVRSEKPLFEQQAAGITVNVESSIMTKGSSALQVLERSPGVLINHRDNDIELNGKTGVMVMLNGKQMRMPVDQLLTLLSGMSADDIVKIELLTTPPANYDAEGSGGIINIVLKKNKRQGTNGSVSFTGGYGWGEKGTGSARLSRNVKKVNLYGSYSYTHNKTYSNMLITSTQDMPFLGGDVAVLFYDTTTVIQNNHDATVGIDIMVNKTMVIGAGINYNGSSASSENITNAGYNVLPDSLLQFVGINRGKNHWNNLVNSVYMEKKISDSEKINVSGDYLYFENNNPYAVQSEFIDKHGMLADNSNNLFAPGQKGFATTSINVLVGKIDYTKQVNKSVKLETGAKVAYTASSSLSGLQSLVDGVWTGSGQTQNNIHMRESIAAVYATLNSQLSKLVNLGIGVRYEHSNTNMRDPEAGKMVVQRKLSSLFPSIFFSKTINDQSAIQMSYTKRISRPSYNDLASYVGYSDPTAVYTGNPFLQPTITHNIKIGYTYKSYAFSLLFSRDLNAISRYQLTESPDADILYVSPQNLAWQNNITLQASLPFKLNKWFTMNNSFVGGLRQYKASFTKELFTKTYFGYSVNSMQSFKLSHTFSAELSGRYNNSFYNGTVTIKGYGIVSAGVKKELKNNYGSLQLSVDDIFTNEKINVFYGKLTQEAFAIKSHVAINTESAKFPIIKLTWSKSFGSNKAKTGKSSSTADEQERIRKN